MASMRDELDRAIRREQAVDLAELDATYQRTQTAWLAAKTYEDAAYKSYKAAVSAYLLALAAQERGQS